MKKFTIHERGQSLFELVLAIAISALVVVTLVSLATNSIQNSNFSKNKARASTYAQQAMEWLRGKRDADIADFITNAEASTDPNKRCLNSLTWPLTIAPCSSGTTITGTPFQRYVVFSFGTDAQTTVNTDVTVSWSDSAGLHEVTNATIFSDWRQK